MNSLPDCRTEETELSADDPARLAQWDADVRSGAVAGAALDALQAQCRRELQTLRDELAVLLDELRAAANRLARSKLSPAA